MSTNKTCMHAGLGVFTALLLVLLAVVTTAWAWTYWTLKKKEGIKISLAQVR